MRSKVEGRDRVMVKVEMKFSLSKAINKVSGSHSLVRYNKRGRHNIVQRLR
jgi:hypothetical protein